VEAGSDPAHPRDTDADGTPDYKDTDSDGDGIPDERETTASGDDDGCAVVAPRTSVPLLLPLAPAVLALWRAQRRRRRGAGAG
jgi:hypothetical protein